MFVRLIAISLILGLASSGQAAWVMFRGTFNITAGPDVLGISNRSFIAIGNTVNEPSPAGVGQIANGHIVFGWNTPGQTLFNFQPGTGDIVLGGGTSSFQNIQVGGGSLRLDINQQLPNPFSQNDWTTMVNTFTPGGSAIWTVGATTYLATVITAVPEPSSGMILCGMVAGVIGLSRRRRK